MSVLSVVIEIQKSMYIFIKSVNLVKNVFYSGKMNIR